MARLKIISLFVFIILAWGLAWPINKIGLHYVSADWYTAFRLIIGTLTMLLLVNVMGKFSLPKIKDLPLILIIGLLQISIFILLANYGLTYLPAGRAALLAYTTPLWIMPVATLIFKEQTSVLRWVGFGLGISGLIVLLSPWQINWASSRTIFGAAMLLLGSLGWAISMLATRYMQWSKSPLELIPWQLLTGTIPILIFACYHAPLGPIAWETPLLLSLAYTGILVTGLSYWCGIIINRELPTIVVSLGFLLVPVVSLLVSSAYLHETISLPTMLAMGLIITGIACVAV